MGRIIKNVQTCHKINRSKIVLAVPDTSESNVFNRYAHDYKIKLFRGSEKDVMQRILDACSKYRIKHFVRICADSPFILPWLIDLSVLEYVRSYRLGSQLEYLRTECFPQGQNVEIISEKALRRIYQICSPKDREHVTLYFDNHPHSIKMKTLDVSLTLDTKADIPVLKEIISLMKGNAYVFSKQR